MVGGGGKLRKEKVGDVGAMGGGDIFGGGNGNAEKGREKFIGIAG